jgi:tetratricopeptide (TPR) repeat protein
MTCGKIFFLPRRIFFPAAFLLLGATVPAAESATEPEKISATNSEKVVFSAPKESAAETNALREITAFVTGTNPPAPKNLLAADTNAAAEYVQPTRLDQLYPMAEKNYEKLLASDVPEDLQKTALFEMALVVQMENDLPRAQSMLEQYLQHWVGDARTPEIFLHQGRIFRQMGLHTYALSKFYAVSTTALSLKNDQLAYYKKLVLTAQLEIAETEFVQGHHKSAADFYSRLLDQNAPGLDRAQVQFRLLRSLSALHQNAETVKQAKDFLERYKDSLDEPEARYYLAQALKGQNRNADALQQVMFFLQEQREKTKDRPEVWAYWQQRVGNEIGNQLYQDGDYIRALEVYLALSKLDGAPAWQLPVRYQVGITYEKLLQPKLASVAYRAITNAAPALGTNLTPGLKSVVDMAQWRLDFLQWQEHAEEFVRPPAEKIPASTNLNLSQK